MNGFDLSTATDIRLGSTTVSAVYYGSNKLWPSHDYSQDYLTFEALEACLLKWTDTNNSNSISYSTDNGSTWYTLASGVYLQVYANDKVMFKASGLTVSNNGIGTFSSSGRFNVMGNIMSLQDGDNYLNSTAITAPNTFTTLFYNCTGLINAQNLVIPDVTLAGGDFAGMFYYCSSLITAPELPATSLAQECYKYMFANCSSLTTAPELPATTLAQGCYHSMFLGCSSLTTTPELPALILMSNCYNNMFYGCTSLVSAPELPATTLVQSCYKGMFNGCTSLNNVTCLATDISATNCTYNWLNGVSATGIFTKNSANNSWPTGASGIPSGWTVQSVTPPHDYSLDYLTLEALEEGTFTWTDTQNSNSIYYSTDNGSTWSTLASGSSTPTIAANNKVMFKASELIVGSNGIGTFSSTGTFNAMGNIMSLVYGDNFDNQTTINNNYQFYKLFKTSKIIDASNLILPATTLAQSCYSYMFESCTLLATPPELPAPTLAELCYDHMFSYCTSLTTAPGLPATILAYQCYNAMFGNCTSLTTAPELPATILAYQCYSAMFGNCTSLITAPTILPATTLVQGCYKQMFRDCTALTTAPALPATTLANNCYRNMFTRCPSLTTAPELPATTLDVESYRGMFLYCTSLNYIKCLATDISASGCTNNWVNGVASSGTFVKDASTSSWTTGAGGIPTGWTVVDAS